MKNTVNVKHVNPQEEMEFRQIFHCELKRYWHPVLGFDVLKFESELNLDSASLSMAEVIRGRFGVAGENLIRSLLMPFQSDRDRIHAENLARVSSPAYKLASSAVARSEKAARRNVRN